MYRCIPNFIYQLKKKCFLDGCVYIDRSIYLYIYAKEQGRERWVDEWSALPLSFWLFDVLFFDPAWQRKGKKGDTD